MIEKLKADFADIVKLSVGVFLGSLSVALQADDFSAPALKAAAVTAGIAAVRVAIAALATKFSK